MAFTCGFYNNKNNQERYKYNSEQLSSIFDGIISDGMYANYKQAMIVRESNNDNEVIVQPGRAWLLHTWSYNDADLPVQAPESEVVLDRIDALVIDVNTDPDVRWNEITWVQGTPASKDPKRPALLNEEFHKQYPLCYVYRAAGTTSITQANITNTVGTSELPFVTGIIDTINTDQLILQWEAQWETFMETYTSEAETWIDTQEGSFLTWSTAQRTAFEAWFESIRGILDEDAAGHIMNIIDARIPAYDSENPAQQITAVRSRKGNYISELRVYANAKPRLFQSADGGQTWEDSSVGGFEPVEISYEDYLALTDEEKDAGDWYVVGMPPMGLNAKTIPYHGDISDAENVEDAIDEVNQNVTTRNTRWNPDTKYWEVQWNGIWYKDRYFDPKWNGIVMDGGNYDSNWYSTSYAQSAQNVTNYSQVTASNSYGSSGQVFRIGCVYNALTMGWDEFVMQKAINVGRPCVMRIWYSWSLPAGDTTYRVPQLALKTTNTANGGNVFSGNPPTTKAPTGAIDSKKLTTNNSYIDLNIAQANINKDLYLSVALGLWDSNTSNPKNTLTIKKIQIIYS